MDHGHPEAANYALGRLSDEAELVTERLNMATITTALAFQTAYVSARVDNGGKLMGDFIKRLTTPGD